MVTKEHVLAEIRRTAEANGGVALGRSRFEAETGIRESDWSGRYWARWSDALAEAGLPPNQLQGRIPDADVFVKLAEEVRRLGRLPTTAELKLRRRQDSAFPTARVFERLGAKAAWPARLASHFADLPEWADVLAIVEPLVAEPEAAADDEPAGEPGQRGFVYLLKSGRFYKVGHTQATSAGAATTSRSSSRRRRPCSTRSRPTTRPGSSATGTSASRIDGRTASGSS